MSDWIARELNSASRKDATGTYIGPDWRFLEMGKCAAAHVNAETLEVFRQQLAAARTKRGDNEYLEAWDAISGRGVDAMRQILSETTDLGQVLRKWCLYDAFLTPEERSAIVEKHMKFGGLGERGYNAMLAVTTKLREDFPRLYPPSLPDDRFTVPVAWADIVRKLSQRLQSKPIVVKQVKEKGGTLRWYFEGDHDAEIDAAIAEAKDAAYVTCDVCGSPSRIISSPTRPGGHSRVCDKCGER